MRRRILRIYSSSELPLFGRVDMRVLLHPASCGMHVARRGNVWGDPPVFCSPWSELVHTGWALLSRLRVQAMHRRPVLRVMAPEEGAWTSPSFTANQEQGKRLLVA